MKLLLTTLFIWGSVAVFAVPVRAQDDVVRMSLSTELKSDPEQMPEAETINVGDPIYFVIKLSPKYKYTLGDLASIDPKSGEKNVFVCFDMNSYRVGEVCPGILKSPVADQDLKRRSAVYTLVPATSDMNAENAKTVRQILNMIDSKAGQDFELRVTYKNFETQKSAVFRAPISMANYERSRWHDYNSLFLNREAAADKQKQNAFDLETKGVVTDWVKNYRSKRVDPTLERGIVKWWKGPDPSTMVDPILRIYFLEPTYEITRNAFGEVLRKTVDALIVWKERTGSKCQIQWRSFGYESLGGGTFSPDMQMWTYDRHIPMAGGRKILAGSWYEVDCAPFVR